MSKEAKITLVELPPTNFGQLDGERAADVYCQVRLPARATPILHAVLEKAGYLNVASIDPQYNPVQNRLSTQDWARIKDSDYLLLSAITRTIPQTAQLARKFRSLNPRGKVIIGGTHATFSPEECLEFADVVVRHEGEKTMIELLDNDGDSGGLLGVSYKKGTELVHEQDRPLLTEEELSELPIPFHDPRVRKLRLMNTVITSRGCPYDCAFCSVTTFYGNRYRRRSNESVMQQIAFEYSHKPHEAIFFADDNFAGRPKEAIALAESITEQGFVNSNHSTQLSIHAAFNPKLLESLKKAGIRTIFIGVESINQDTLDSLNKKVSVEQNKEAIRIFREYGFWVHGMMMVGGDGDTKESLQETSAFSKDHFDTVQYFTPIPVQGTRFEAEMKAAGRVLPADYSYYDGQYVLIRPVHFSPYELQMEIMRMYQDFYSYKNIRQILQSQSPLRSIAFRYFAHQIISGISHSPQTKSYLKFLQDIK